MSNTSNIEVTKASGERETFDVEKLRNSLRKAGASSDNIEAIVSHVREHLVDGISTRKIYRRAFQKLREISASHAARYRIKESLFELGPSGYPFERFVAEMLRRKGYHTRNGIILQGKCVSHEVDVLATLEGIEYMIECKFHNRPGYKCDVKIPLYIHSRFEDIFNHQRERSAGKPKHVGWLVTNTRFSSDALKYGKCVGLEMLSWDYPRGSAIKDWVDKVNLHPVTSLTELSKDSKEQLLKREIIFCTQLQEHPRYLSDIGLGSNDQKKVLREVNEICNQVN
ncbi:MAG: ATP cone domain-containing protein [Bacteroidota bacterium]